MELTPPLALLGTGSGVFAVATWTGGVSGGSLWDESVKPASTFDCGSSEATVVSMAVPVADAAALATSALPTAALPVAGACGAFACSASAGEQYACPSPIGPLPVLLIPAHPT